MKEIDENIDQLILSKPYKALSEKERKAVKAFVADEKEYNSFRAMLIAATQQINIEDELIPNPAIRSKLIADFEQYRPALGYQKKKRNGGFFPKGTPIYKMPGVQFLAVAASIAVLIGVFFNSSSFVMSPSSEEMAIQDNKLTIEEELAIEKNRVNPVVKSQPPNKDDNGLVSSSDKYEGLPNQQMDYLMLKDEKEKELESFFGEVNEEEITVMDELLTKEPLPDNQIDNNELITDFDAINKNEVTDIVFSPSTGNSNPVVDSKWDTKKNQTLETGIYKEKNDLSQSVTKNGKYHYGGDLEGKDMETESVKATAATEKVYSVNTSGRQKGKLAQLPKSSKSLAEDAELIQYFYTTM